MLKTIIKRDGSQENFCPSKVNQWSEWASENLGTLVDWSMVVLDTVEKMGESCTSQQLQLALIDTCISQNTWSYNKMAGRLYAVYLSKAIHGDNKPTIQQLHKKLIADKMMVYLDYTDEQYTEIEKRIVHSRDMDMAHFQLHQIRNKYSLVNRVTGKENETAQFTYMRMAMALAEKEPEDEKVEECINFYEEFSMGRLNAPTPNFVNLGTSLRGYASCCVYKVDDNEQSLAIGDHIAYRMTCASAGIGNNITTRGVGEAIRGGMVTHRGRNPYYRSVASAVAANKQNGRGGACTTYYSAFDPEAADYNLLRSVKATEDKKIMGIDYAMMTNKFFARKAARNEDIFVFSCQTAPDLYEAFYSSDQNEFATLYKKYEEDDSFAKRYTSARELLLSALNQGYETNRHYLAWADEMNHHTPFKEKIYSSNLCTEVMLVTAGYSDMIDLYSSEDHGRGEVATCNLAAVVISNIHSPEQHRKTIKYALRMCDKTIHLAEYKLPHIGVTSKARMSVGVGITGLAYYLAKKGLKYDTPEGLKEMHELAERHSYFLIDESIELGKKLGNAPWMHKTKWPEGWLPIDTYNKNVDSITPPVYLHDWEALRAKLIANKGMRNSVVCNHMPVESSSKANGAPNQLIPIRGLTMIKTDGQNIVDWVAPEGDSIGHQYQIAWDIDPIAQLKPFAVFQKFADQGISSELYADLSKSTKVTSEKMLEVYFFMTKHGFKSRYYQHTRTTVGADLQKRESSVEANCDGVCAL